MPLSERGAAFRDASLFVLGLEGETTGAEHRYFSDAASQDIFDPRRLRVVLLPTAATDHGSDPAAVLRRVETYVEAHRLKPFDRVWLVIDFDSWGEKKLVTVANAARAAGYVLAVSNPCFELWLLLHAPSFASDSLGATPARERSAVAKSTWKAHRVPLDDAALLRACEAAKSLAARDAVQAYWPSCPGSHVYRLFDELYERNLLHPELRQRYQVRRSP